MAERGIIFKESYLPSPDRSWFDMSYDNLYSCNLGEIIPSLVMECMAKDEIHQKTDVFARLAPMVSPAFGKINLFNYHFYVRNRDIWKNWDAFFTNADQKEAWQQNLSFVPPTMPYIDIRKVLYNSTLFLPSQSIATPTISDGVVSLDTDYFNKLGARVLLIQYDDQASEVFTREHLVSDDYATSFNADSFNSAHCHSVAIVYIPNKSDFHEVKNLQKYYNPFSNGSLFDFLGVDIEPSYKINLDIMHEFRTEFNKIADYGNAEITTWLDEKLGTELLGINLSEFLKTHAILNIIGISKTGDKVAVNVGSGKVAGYSSDSTVAFATQFNNFQYHDYESAKISSLPLRAYYFIYSEYFRDQNYVGVNKNVDFTRDGEDIDWSLSTDIIFDYLTLKVKSWEHDPYTTALPGPQRGNAVRYLPDSAVIANYVPSGLGATTKRNLNIGIDSAFNQKGFITDSSSSVGASDLAYNLQVDLSAATIENFRFANATQRFLEKVARTGNRYYEYMIGIFGAEIPDAKLNRPIYLGGDKTPIQISEVLQTSASDLQSSQPLGQMAGRAVAVGSDDRLEYTAPDHGFFIEVSATIPRVSYQQGISPYFMRKVQLDFAIPDYAQLGEEPVLTRDLYYAADDTVDDVIFGFQSRYWNLKYNRDCTHGEFKDSLDHWTFTRKFDTTPVAGKTFLEVKPDYRQFAVTDSSQEHIYVTMWHDLQVNRALPIFGIPSL